MSGKGEGSLFSYHAAPAWFGSFEFNHQNIDYFSYLLIVQSNNAYYIMLAFTPVGLLDNWNDYLVSILDSFRLPEYIRFFSGPVGSFDRYYSNPQVQMFDFQIGSYKLQAPMRIDFKESQFFAIEREAAILQREGSMDAWKRFYRMIFRDSYADLQPLAQAIEEAASGQSSLERVKMLLSWVQVFDYERSGTLADMHSPLYSALNSTGDCDTRALLLSILLKFAGIESIMLVSTEYMHGLSGVLVEYQGAHFVHREQVFIIAETTEKVNFGLIAADMADPAHWFAIDLWE